MDNGWIKIHRKFLEWEWFQSSEMVHLYIYLIVSANHSAKRWRGMVVKRGQLVTGRSKLSLATSISERTIRTCLKRLEESGEITMETTSNYSIITICKYASCQQIEKQSDQRPTNDRPTTDQRPTNDRPTTDQRPTNDRPTTDQRPTTNKNDKNDKNIKKREGVKIDKQFSPPSTDEVKKFILEKNYSVDAEAFVAFYTSKNWMVGRNKMKCWQAAVTTWEKREKKVAPKKREHPITDYRKEATNYDKF